MNEVTQEILDESLKSIKDYLDNISTEEIYKTMLETASFEGVPASEVIGYYQSNPLDELSIIDQELGLYDELATLDDAYLDLLDNGIDRDIKLIPDDVWERVKSIREKARIARGEE